MGKFIWTIAHNTLSNYYRDTAKSMVGISMDKVAELLADPHAAPDADDNAEAIHRLQIEIAYLSMSMRNWCGPMWNSNGNHILWQIVILASDEIRDKLLAIGERIKAKHRTDFDALKAPYAEAVLESVPAHLRKITEYELQFVFHADGWFLLHCITALLKDGKLTAPTKGQRNSLTTLIVNA